jgi:hypothetical protein
MLCYVRVIRGAGLRAGWAGSHHGEAHAEFLSQLLSPSTWTCTTRRAQHLQCTPRHTVGSGHWALNGVGGRELCEPWALDGVGGSTACRDAVGVRELDGTGGRALCEPWTSTRRAWLEGVALARTILVRTTTVSTTTILVVSTTTVSTAAVERRARALAAHAALEPRLERVHGLKGSGGESVVCRGGDLYVPHTGHSAQPSMRRVVHECSGECRHCVSVAVATECTRPLIVLAA